jgi:mono/diheme cytochrome c family protein
LGYQRLSENGQLYAWLIFGGMIVGGFFFGIVAGYQRAPVIQYSAESKTSSTEKNPATIEKGDNLKNKDSTTSPGTAPKIPASPPDKKDEDKGTNPSASTKTDTSSKTEESPAPPPKKELASNLPPPNPPPVPKNPPPPKNSDPPPKKETSTTPPANLTPVSFQKDVLPIFRTYCLNCHGAGSGKPKDGVDLRTIATIMKGNKSGAPILVVGQPEKSAIYTTIEDMSMPPDGKRPSPQELAIIRNWILTGAKERRRRSYSRSQSR